MKTVMILGGMGFIGWPTSLKFLNEGYNVIAVDNLSRSNFDLNTRLESPISFARIDIANEYDKLKDLFNKCAPDHVIHLGEQRSAPHSMLDRRYTVNNNIQGTHNILNLLVGTNTNIVHIGSMGVYGYDGNQDGFNPGSIYHMTKCMDNQMFRYYNKNWNIEYSDLHQGIVWGWQTKLTSTHNYGQNTFDYDGIYGTVFNRFCFEPDLQQPQAWGEAKWPRTRWPLSIALSEDDGDSWPWIRDIDTGFGFCGPRNWTLNGQLAYPSMVEGLPGELHVTYSWAGREAIRYVCLTEDDILGVSPGIG